VHAIVVHFSTNFIFELSIYYRASNQNSRTIALKLILEWVIVVRFPRFSLHSNFAGFGNFTVKYIKSLLHTITGYKPSQSRNMRNNNP